MTEQDAAKKAVIEHAPIEWEKPAWTSAKLQQTAEGDKVKAAGDLQKPITHVNKDRFSSEQHPMTALRATGSLSSLQSGKDLATPTTHIADLRDEKNIGWQKPGWTVEQKLQQTAEGDKVKADGDLQKPITHVNKDRFSSEQHPMTALRATGSLSSLQSGKDLATPTTHIADLRDEKNIGWQKPGWAVEQKLQQTAEGDKVKAVGDLQKPITNVNKDRAAEDAKPDQLKQTTVGSFIRQGQNAERPITFTKGKE
jgi:hypothetical protein